MRKDILEKKLSRLETKKSNLSARALASEDVNEVRAINAQLEELNAEIDETREEIAAIEEETRSIQPVTASTTIPEGAKLVNGSTVASFNTPAADQRKKGNVLESVEYRSAFMKYVQEGTETRDGEVIVTKDTAPAIPLTIMNEVMNTVRKRYGNLYNKVRKTSMKGGVEYPIGALKATFKWINEATVSPRQKLDPLAKVSFFAHVAEIRIAQSFLSQILTMEAFEAEIARVIAIAYLQAMDEGIVKGTGNGQMLGILNDPRVLATGNVVEMSASDINNWKKWEENFFAKLKLGYHSGEFIFTNSTVHTCLKTMSDANGNPVFYQATGLVVGDGDDLNPGGYFFGHDISVVEPDILPDFATANAGDVIGIFWQPEEYAINENFGFTMRRYFDEETNEWVDKALVVVDGKTLNPEGFWLIKKK